MKIVDLGTYKPELKKLSIINIGTVFQGKFGGCDSTYLVTCDRVVDLSDPTRSYERASDYCVQSYREVDAEVVVRGPKQ